MGVLDTLKNIFSWDKEKPNVPVDTPLVTKDSPTVNRPIKGISLPGGRVSVPTVTSYNTKDLLSAFTSLKTLPPEWYLPLIPVIRKLTQSNPDLGQALKNVINLGNTGHKIYFDSKVKPEVADKMRRHLDSKHKEWAPNYPGAHGLVNSLFAQAAISGALSIEWVPNIGLTTIESVVFPNPEEIVFKLNSRGTTYIPYQSPPNNFFKDKPDNLIKLNSYTYKYYALNGDGSSPYGCPEYLTSLRGIKTQTKMLDNIDFVIDQLGIMGFIELFIDKPEMVEGESTDKYYARLETRLALAKERAKSGFADGVIVGYKDDHDINFNPTSKDFKGVKDLYEQNELMIASGTKQDAALWGRGYSTSETQITIIFTKLLSELKNLQKSIAHCLEYGYQMELILAGFEFEFLKVKFNPSTIQDELKYQQAQEIKIRNLESLMMDGIINQDQFADAMDYDVPFLDKPLVPYDRRSGVSQQEKKDKKLKDKNASERKTTDKNNPQGTTKKQK